MAGNKDVFSGPLEGWEPIDSASAGVDSTKLSQKPDRVAQEFVKVARKYAAGRDASREESTEHSTLVRAKKKGTLDTDVSAKTFVFSGNKVVGSQG